MQHHLAEFAATCRDETGLEKLTARLVEVVEETMQPESVGLWLKDFNAKTPGRKVKNNPCVRLPSSEGCALAPLR